MSTINERIAQCIAITGLTKTAFAQRINLSQPHMSKIALGHSAPTDRTIADICREFNVNEVWLRTGEGEMFAPTPNGALDALAREYELSPGMYVLIKRLLALKPENQQAAVDFAIKLAEDLNRLGEPAATTPPAPERTEADTSGHEQTEPDLAVRMAELERRNRELAAEIAAMKEEDVLLGLTDASSASPSASAGSVSPVEKVKK